MQDGATFAALSAFMASLSFMIIVTAIFMQRSIIVKPSFIFCIFYFSMVQVGSAFKSDDAWSMLSDPWSYFFLIHVFTLIALLYSISTFRHTTAVVFEKITAGKTAYSHRVDTGLILLLLLLAGIVTLYLTVVPFHKTGLYAILFNPSAAAEAREQSFKLLPNPLVRYAYASLQTAVAPLTSILLSLTLLSSLKKRLFFRSAIYAGLILIVVIAASLPGARATSALIVLVVLFALYLRAGAPLNPIVFAMILLAVTLFPAVITLMREGGQFSFEKLWLYIESIFGRIFIRGAPSNYYTLDYVQTHGYFGIGVIGKLASLINVEPVNVDLIIGTKYINKGAADIATTYASPAFNVIYYSGFGLVAYPISFIIVLALDFLLLAYKRLKSHHLIALAAALVIPVSSLAYTAFTTALISGGLFLSIGIIYVLYRLSGGNAADEARDDPKHEGKEQQQ